MPRSQGRPVYGFARHLSSSRLSCLEQSFQGPATASAPPVANEGVTKVRAGDDSPFAQVRMISPLEVDYAFVLAAYRDINDSEKLDQWKRLTGCSR